MTVTEHQGSPVGLLRGWMKEVLVGGTRSLVDLVVVQNLVMMMKRHCRSCHCQMRDRHLLHHLQMTGERS